jgi:hypothetical protein
MEFTHRQAGLPKQPEGTRLILDCGVPGMYRQSSIYDPTLPQVSEHGLGAVCGDGLFKRLTPAPYRYSREGTKR